MKRKYTTIFTILTFLFCSSIQTINAQNAMPQFSDLAADVDPHSGSANMGIPIEVPAGRAGIQPNVSLQYNSRLKNNILGVGWVLELGSIQIITNRGVPKYDSSDRYSLTQSGSSQELVYDSSAGFYRTKIEGAFSKIEKVNDHWVITDKKGTKYFFGQTQAAQEYDPADATHIFKWCINRVEDIHGNYMTYDYLRDSNKLYPHHIYYTGNTTQNKPTYAHVEFEHDGRTDPSMSYISGFKRTTAKRISDINVYVDTNLQRRYSFTYTQSPITQRSLLSSMTRFGADGISTQPASTFRYHDQKGYQLASGWTIPDGIQFRELNFFGSLANLGIFPVDLNGDGYTDFLRSNLRQTQTGDEHYKQAFLNTKNNGWVETTNWIPKSWDAVFNQHPEYYSRGVRFIDINGDGWTDELLSHYENGTQYSNAFINNQTDELVVDYAWDIPSPNMEITVNPTPASTGTVLSDVNGDGYVDYVRSNASEQKTYLNKMGTTGQVGWQRDTSWDVPDNQFARLNNRAMFIDLNGDGLQDIFYSDLGTNQTESTKVFMNTGSNWVEDTNSPWANVFDTKYLFTSHTRPVDINGDGLLDLVKLKSDAASGFSKVLINTENGWVVDNSFLMHEGDFAELHTKLFDANADGLIDYMNFTETKKELYLNISKPTDLLYEIDNGIGGITTITYESSAHFDNTFLPFITQVVKSVESTNSLNDTYTTTYEYEDGLWDVDKREFRGFGMVKVMDVDNNYTMSTFDQTEFMQGRVIEQASYDANDNMFAKTVNTWDSEDVVTGESKFVFLKRKDNFVYDENSSTGKRTAEEFFYDESTQYGNLTKAVQLGEVNLANGNDIGSDKRTVETTYVNNTSSDWIIGLPSETIVKDHNNQIMRKTWFDYDNQANGATPSEGMLTKKKDWLDGVNDPVTEYTYDAYGNLKDTTDSNNNTTTITYDTQYNIFPRSTQNARTHNVTNEYYGVDGVPLSSGGLEGLWGQLKSTTDPNQEKGMRCYDTFGRLTDTISPMDTVALPTTHRDFTFNSDHVKVMNKVRVDHGQTQTIDTVQYTDALGRVIQSKTPSGTTGQFIVSGQTVYNERGLPEKQFLPYFTSNSLDVMDAIDASKPHTVIEYDAMGRVTRTTNPDGSYSTVEYDDWLTRTINENGHMQESVFDAYGRLIEKREYEGADGRSSHYSFEAFTLYATTQYAYDSEGNLKSTIDDHGNTTTITYDNLGRKIAMNDPDMGNWTYTYDANGNLATQTDAKGVTITFTYDNLNRLVNKTDGNQLDVDYTYDDAAVSYSKGRLTKAQYDTNDETEFKYDELGREVESIKKINAEAHNVQRNYNGLNNLLDIKYPDGSNVYYDYNDAGQIKRISNEPIGPQSFLRTEKFEDAFVAGDKEGREKMEEGSASRFLLLTSHFTKQSLAWFEQYVLGVKPAYANQAAEITSPTPGSVLTSSTVTFQWTTGSGVEEYWLDIGSSSGSSDIYSEWMDTNTSDTVSGLPQDGSTIYVQIWSKIGGWQVNEYTYQAGGSGGGTPADATISANPTTINENESATITWSSTDATSCTASGGASGWSGSKALSGSENYTLTSNTTFTIECSGAGGSSGQKNVTVTVQSSGGGGLPSPWVNQDIGSGVNGDATYANGTFTVTGYGSDIWGTSDEFHFVHQSVNGDGEIVAKVTSMTNTDEWAKAGVMIRETLADDAKNVMMLMTPGNGAVMQYRDQTGGGSSEPSCCDGQSAPYWVKLVRSGNTFTGYKSSNGSSWTQVSSITISMSSDVYIGMATTSPNNSQILTAVFDSVSTSFGSGGSTPTASLSVSPTSISEGESATLTWSSTNADSCTASNGWNGAKATSGNESVSPTATTTYSLVCSGAGGSSAQQNVTLTVQASGSGLPSPWAHQDVGSGVNGDATYAGGTFSVQGRGFDIWGDSDEFHFVHQSVNGDGEIVAKVSSMTNTDEWAKAGVMMRETFADDAKNVMMLMTPGNGAVMQYRDQTGGQSSEPSCCDGQSAPYWVKLVRSGDTFTGYKSSDGNSWTQVSSINIPMSADVYVGLAVTSHNTSQLLTAEFDHVNVDFGSNIGAVDFVTDVQYNAAGQITRIEYGNGVITTREYNELNLRLKRIHTVDANGADLQDLNYLYDSVGNIIEITDNVNTATQSLEYDEFNRLTSANGQLYGQKDYRYDEIGNIIEKDGETYYYGNNAGPHAVTSLSDGSTFTYDANGNMITKFDAATSTSKTYIYDVENRLTEVREGITTLERYEYDGDGGRTKKLTHNGANIDTTTYVGSLFEKIETSSAVRNTQYVFLGDQRVASISQGNVMYFHADHLGGTNVLTDDLGAIKEKTEYLPFGGIANQERLGSSAEIAMYYFTGKPLDEKTGLYYYGARYYDSSLGRFLTPDIYIQSPSNSQSFNRYSYVINNPVNFIDPTGHFWKALFRVVSTLFKIASRVRTVATVAAISTGSNTFANIAQSIPNFTSKIGAAGGILSKGGITNCIAQGNGCSGGGFALSLTENLPETTLEPIIVVATRLEPTVLDRFVNGVSNIVSFVSGAIAKSGAVIDGAQRVLDIAGLVPGIGEPFDLLNAGVSAVRGDFLGAGLSAAGAVPFIGSIATAGKFGGRIKGFTKHGLNQVIGRNGGRGVAAKSVLDAVRNPKRIVQQSDGATKYIGDQAGVVLNPKGEVVTAFGSARGPAQQIYGNPNRVKASSRLQKKANNFGYSVLKSR